jgi:2-polyprenyl-6-methoxyphenol hydroxylase-like FAD-dependent oxidoreductase
MEATMAMDFDVDVVICGAGPAGLALAIDLARRGVPIRLIEKMDAASGGSRGKGLQPRTLEVFEDLGVLDRIAAAGGPYPPQREYEVRGGFSQRDVIDRQEPTPAEPYPAPLMVPQFRTERVMRERLVELGCNVESGCELIAFDQDEDGVAVRYLGNAGEKKVRARYLVGADGGRSFVRNSLGIAFPGETLGVRAIVADIALSGLERDVWHRFNEGSMERQISLCPLAGTDLFQLQAPLARGDFDPNPEALSRLVAERTARNDIHVGSIAWASTFTMNARLADHYRCGRVFLVGDAAHIHPPTGGQGLNTSVQDAYNLGWKLAGVLRGAPEPLLDSYEEERRPIAAAMLGLSTQLLEAQKRGEMRRGREVRQLDLGYASSSLSLDRPENARLLIAGDRAPDAPVHGAAGAPTRLFSLFQGAHWTLLGYDVERSLVPPRPALQVHTLGPGGDIIDADGRFQDAYALTVGDWALIRPDGYIGAIISSRHVDELERYLQRVGLGLADAPSGR